MFRSFVLYTLVGDRALGAPPPTVDPCLLICNEFTAQRRGHGHDLCESPELSHCIMSESSMEQVCSNLYWDTTEDGGRGLTYSTDVLSHPVTCADAVRILEPPTPPAIGGIMSPPIPPRPTVPIPTTTTRRPFYLNRDPEQLRIRAIAGCWPSRYINATTANPRR